VRIPITTPKPRATMATTKKSAKVGEKEEPVRQLEEANHLGRGRKL
jgi:hypothetical protein